jgi:cupin fold WbuC family metalloprotein
MSKIQIIDEALIRSLVERARNSPRLRVNHNFHSSMEDNPHRFLNVMLKGTYVAPHRHLNPPKSESFVVLDGKLAFFTFHDDGGVASSHILGPATPGIDLRPGVWHSLTPVTEHAVCYEVKPGPYVASSDKEFAAWAPAEGDAGVAVYLKLLLESVGAS